MLRKECMRCGAHTFEMSCGNCWSMHLRPVAGVEVRLPSPRESARFVREPVVAPRAARA